MPETMMDYELIAKALFENYETIYDIDVQTNAYCAFHESTEYKRLKIQNMGADFFRELKRKCLILLRKRISFMCWPC